MRLVPSSSVCNRFVDPTRLSAACPAPRLPDSVSGSRSTRAVLAAAGRAGWVAAVGAWAAAVRASLAAAWCSASAMD